MNPDVISPQISERVFLAIDALIQSGRLSNLQEFCTRYGISLRLAYFQRNEPARRILRPSWLTYLVRDYGVSADWLLLGEGFMLRDPALRDEKRAKNVQQIRDLLAELL